MQSSTASDSESAIEDRLRARVKRGLARAERLAAIRPLGISVLIYHRVGGGSPDERDLDPADFARQMDALDGHDVVSLDEAVDRLAAGDERPAVVLTFDDGFRDVYENAWPALRQRRLPFTVFVASAYVGGCMHWEGSTAKAAGPALSWTQLGDMLDSGLCTVGNHTHTHARPERLTVEEVDACSEAIRSELAVAPRHFAYPWGIAVPHAESFLRDRFRSATTGQLGRNRADSDPMRWRRIPVRRTDPIEFFHAKLTGSLVPERAYDVLVRTAKRLGVRA